MYDEHDHRNLGERMDLFHFEEEAPGMVFWHPRGFAVFRRLEAAVRAHIERDEFQEVRSPLLMKRSLWEQSGHWESFGEGIFKVEGEGDGQQLAVKPVNCPAHVRLYERARPSHRDLPMRIAEFGIVHRNEPSGALSGLFRLRQFTQDDGHIFCREDQVEAEIARFARALFDFYRHLGFEDVKVAFSTRPRVRFGSDQVWDRAEAWLESAAQASGLSPHLQPGEGAFYGPKLEFVLQDRIGRDWQCGTIQLDLVLPERFDLSYVGEDGKPHRPVMLHRALLGSLERFIGVLLEHCGGVLPAWLAPEQVVVAPVSEAQAEVAAAVSADFASAGLRSRLDARSATLGKRLREARLLGVPFVAVVGPREAESKAVSLSAPGGEVEVLAISAAIASLQALCR
jgi:threonyl-tRNA synthetase